MNNLFFIGIAKGAGLVPCGGPGEVVCTSCHLFLLIQNLLRYAMQLGVVFAVISLVVLGLQYMVNGEREKVKIIKRLKSLGIGILLVMGAWTIINTVIVIVSPGQGILNN
jgi:hypothetical protein